MLHARQQRQLSVYYYIAAYWTNKRQMSDGCTNALRRSHLRRLTTLAPLPLLPFVHHSSSPSDDSFPPRATLFFPHDDNGVAQSITGYSGIMTNTSLSFWFSLHPRNDVLFFSGSVSGHHKITGMELSTWGLGPSFEELSVPKERNKNIQLDNVQRSTAQGGCRGLALGQGSAARFR